MTKFGRIAGVLALSAAIRAGTLTGIVADSSMTPAPSAVVELSSSRSGYARRALTAADGSFTISKIPAGGYVLRVALPGFRTHHQVLAIGENGLLDLRIRLALADVRTQ